MSTAQFSNYIRPDYDPESIRFAGKGKNSVYALALTSNEPRSRESVAGKITKVIIDSYLRRPALKDEALMKMTEFAHNAICVEQTPKFPVGGSLAVLMTQGNRFRWLCAGDVRIFHLVNGQIINSNKGTSPELGSSNAKDMPPEGLPEQVFSQNENSFLLCSGSFTRYVTPGDIEETLSLSETAEDWMRALKDLYEDRCNGEPFSIMTVFIPSPKKRPSKTVVLVTAVLIILAAAVFFTFGAIRRRNSRPDPSQAGPGQPGTESAQPVKPTPPPEPTEPPEPSEPMPGYGQPGVKPTKPPKPTPPPEPTPPDGPEDSEQETDQGTDQT